MIWLRHDIVWVRDDAGNLTAFNTGRLAASIKRAAGAQGIPDWWLAEPLGLAVGEFIIHSAGSENLVDAGEMAKLISSILSKLGFPEIANAYERRLARTEIRLDQLDNGFELEFYRELDAALNSASSAATCQLEVTGLRCCVMRLRGASRWCNSCRQLAAEIIEHVRERVIRLRPEDADALSLAVVE